MHNRLSHEKFWALHAETDIALDSYPYNGGTTTCESLWMGLPVIAVQGKNFVSRMSHRILSNINLRETSAINSTEYINIAVGLANDLNRLNKLRCQLREQMKASCLMDEKKFVKDIESAYRSMWITWCKNDLSVRM